MEQRPPRRVFTVLTAVFFVFSFVVGAGTASADISLGGVSPTWASTRGGPVIFFGVSPVSSFTATIDGVPVNYFVNPAGAPSRFAIIPPPHAPGPVQFTVRGNDGTTASVTITYVELPAIGLASPVERVSLKADGTEGTHRGNGAQGSIGGATSADGRYVLFLSETDLGFGPISPSLPFAYRPLIKDRQTGALTRVHSGHTTCDNFCGSLSMSLDGSVVVYVRDTGVPTTDRHVVITRAPFPAAYDIIDVDANGGLRPGSVGTATLSGDGTTIAFTTTANLDGNSQDSGTSTDCRHQRRPVRSCLGQRPDRALDDQCGRDIRVDQR